MNTRMILTFVTAALVILDMGCASYQTPRNDAHFGSRPANYSRHVRQYILGNFHYPPDARFKIGTPRRAYMNKGIFLGGDIEWLGYILDVHVQSVGGRLRRSNHYVVRMRNNEVVEVHDVANTPVLHEM
jgi:hypothetical protein